MIDLYPLIEFIQQMPFRIEMASSVLNSIRKDLKDAYFQVPIHKAFFFYFIKSY